MKKINSDEIKIRCDTFAVTAGKNGYVEERIVRLLARSSIIRYDGALLALLLSVTHFSTKFCRFGTKINNNKFGAKIIHLDCVKLLFHLLF